MSVSVKLKPAQIKQIEAGVSQQITAGRTHINNFKERTKRLKQGETVESGRIVTSSLKVMFLEKLEALIKKRGFDNKESDKKIIKLMNGLININKIKEYKRFS